MHYVLFLCYISTPLPQPRRSGYWNCSQAHIFVLLFKNGLVGLNTGKKGLYTTFEYRDTSTSSLNRTWWHQRSSGRLDGAEAQGKATGTKNRKPQVFFQGLYKRHHFRALKFYATSTFISPKPDYVVPEHWLAVMLLELLRLTGFLELSSRTYRKTYGEYNWH